MKTIIAEKPSVAREIARIVGATKREEGYFEGGGYAVTWAFGHLVQLAMPDGYGVRGFVRDNLPIIPDTFTLVPRQIFFSAELMVCFRLSASAQMSRWRQPSPRTVMA